MGSCATLWAFTPVDLAGLVGRAPPAPPRGVDSTLWADVLSGAAHDDDVRERLREEAEAVPVESVAAATWRDPADNDLSRMAQGQAFQSLPAERAAEALKRPALLERHAGRTIYPWQALEAAEGEALAALGGLLGLGRSRAADAPWWITARWGRQGDGFCVGLLAPDDVRALRDALRATRLFDTLLAWDEAATKGSYRRKTFATLGAFLERAADGGCAVLGVEGQS